MSSLLPGWCVGVLECWGVLEGWGDMLGCGDMWGWDMGEGAMCCWERGDWGTM